MRVSCVCVSLTLTTHALVPSTTTTTTGTYVGQPFSYATRREALQQMNELCTTFGSHSEEEWEVYNGPMLVKAKKASKEVSTGNGGKRSKTKGGGAVEARIPHSDHRISVPSDTAYTAASREGESAV